MEDMRRDAVASDDWYRSHFRCSNYNRDVRCHHGAAVLLVCTGKVVPGYWCQECADRIVQEYAEKLGETWTTEPLKAPDGG